MINARTELYGITGNPVRKSLSPLIHNRAFKRLGMNAVYLAFELNRIEEAATAIRFLGIRGLSVTTPYKMSIIPFLDGLDPLAQKIGSINTILNHDGKLIGYNTDSLAALKALQRKIDPKGKKAILLGAGGAARSIAYALKEKGCEVVLFNRSLDKGLILAKELGFPCYPLSDLGEVNEQAPNATILINATSLGMSPHEDTSPFPGRLLRKGMIVMDIVYQPLRTKLLREAKAAGCKTIDGLVMLAYQGAFQLEIWTAKTVNPKRIEADLRRYVTKASLQRESKEA